MSVNFKHIYDPIFSDPRHFSKDFPRVCASLNYGDERCSNCVEFCATSFMSTNNCQYVLCMGCYKAIKALFHGAQTQQPQQAPVVGKPFNFKTIPMDMPPQPALKGSGTAGAAANKNAFSFGGPIGDAVVSSMPDKKRPLNVDNYDDSDEVLPPEVIEAKKNGMR